MTQLVELQQALPRFEAAGIKLYAVSYDEPEALAEFARHHGITFPLLSDKGSKVIKRYDTPTTPYQRLLAAGILSPPAQAAIEQQFLAISPAQLRGRIDELLRELWRTAERPNAGGR